MLVQAKEALQAKKRAEGVAQAENAIKSNMIKKVFEHEKGIPVKSAKYDKSTIYEKMLPSIVIVVVLLDEKK